MKSAVCAHIESEQKVHDPYQELKQYLNSSLEPDITDPVKWWRVSFILVFNFRYLSQF